MRNVNYVHKTSKEQLEQFKAESKHGGELLHKVFMNEVGKGIPYQEFLSKLATWLRRYQGVDTRDGVQTINKYLREKLV